MDCIRSMTGYGLGEAPLGSGRVILEARAVNHRYLEVRVRLPIELATHAGEVEARAREALRRGRVEVIGRLEGEVHGRPILARERAKSAFEQLCALRDELRPGEDVPLSLLATVPDLFGSVSGVDHDEARAAVLRATDAACEAVWAMRVNEGQALAEDLTRHLDTLEHERLQIEARAPELVREHRERLRARLERLLVDTEEVRGTLDAGRLEHEVALFADRADVSEELARLASHVAQARELLAGAAEAGKRLDFLLQEMSREANTIGSKSSDADLARRVIEVKAAISRMREQAQNVL